MHRSQRQRGMTLVEVATSVALLGLLLTGIFATLATAQRAETFTRERQAASSAAFNYLDLVAAHPDFTGTKITWDGQAFHVPYGAATLPPASSPINAGADKEKAGRIQVVELDLDGDGEADDYDADGAADLIEVRVTVRWKSSDGSDQRIEALVRRTR